MVGVVLLGSRRRSDAESCVRWSAADAVAVGGGRSRVGLGWRRELIAAGCADGRAVCDGALVPAGWVAVDGGRLPVAAGPPLHLVGGGVRVVRHPAGHELLVGDLFTVDGVGVVAHVALGEEVVALAEPLCG